MLWYSLEAPRRGASNEYPQHMFSLRKKKDISIFRMKKAPYLLLCSTMVIKLKVCSWSTSRIGGIMFLSIPTMWLFPDLCQIF